jgi:uncharacterized RDD family membrane protein YckC
LLSVVDAAIQAGTSRLVSGIVGIVIGASYTILMLGGRDGATLGMRAVGIRIIDVDSGGRVEYGQCAIRYLVAIVSGLACGIGYLWMLWDPERQTWHDKAANVYVVPTRFFPTPG